MPETCMWGEGIETQFYIDGIKFRNLVVESTVFLIVLYSIEGNNIAISLRRDEIEKNV